MKKELSILVLFFVGFIHAQNKKILYGFDNIPQGLLLNPGQENSYKSHIGIPVLSGLSLDANISGITLATLFKDDGVGAFSGTDFNIKIENALNKIGDKDYLSINSQIEVLSGGYKLNERDYLSFGFYEEVDAFMGFPKDVLDLIVEGNGGDNIGRSFTASEVALKAEMLGVLHAGITRRFNNRITVGARFKIYSGALNVTSINNKGTFITKRNTNQSGIYTHSLNNLEGNLYTSGVYEEGEEGEDEISVDVGSAIGDSFFGGNLGLGVDIGFTYHVNKQMELTASLLDIGFVSYSKNTKNVSIDGGYNFSGVDFNFLSTTDYFEELENDFEDNVFKDENSETYYVSRPIKFNSSFRYSFGKSRYLANCHDIRLKDFYDNAVGAQLYAVSRPYGVRMAFTGFYERKFAEFLNTKVTWTVDDFSATNFGIGISTNFWKMNVYGMLDNIFQLGDISDSHTFSAQLGINLIFN